MATIGDFARAFENEDIIKISLENSTKTFSVQQALLNNASPYFEKALSNGFKETTDRTLRLPGCDEQTFQCFLYWLCHGQGPTQEQIQPEHYEREYERSVYQEQLVRLWVFGRKYLIPRLQNTVMKQMMGHYATHVIELSTVELVYELTESESTLRAFIAREAVADYGNGGAEYWETDCLGAIPGFTGDFIDALVECRGSKCNHEEQCRPSSTTRREQLNQQYFVAEEEGKETDDDDAAFI